MPDQPDHVITIDEIAATVDETDQGYQAKAFCSCGWCSDRWHHDDQYPSGNWESDPSAAIDAAHDAAVADGAAHLAEVN
jgi:hypothetical protein